MTVGGVMAQIRVGTVPTNNERRRMRHRSAQPVFHCLVEEYAKREVDTCKQRSGIKEASHGVVCGSKQISVFAMRKTQHKLKTEHFVARTLFSVSRTFDVTRTLRVAQGPTTYVWDVLHLLRIVKVIHSQHVSSTTPRRA